MELLREGPVLITMARAQLGKTIVSPGEFDACFVEVESEHAQRIGNILFANLAVAAALYFFVPIQIGLLETKFYLAVGLFGLLTLVALDDVRRSNALTAYRLKLRKGEDVLVAFATTDQRFARRIECAMQCAIAASR